jgi:hypothetical protein
MKPVSAQKLSATKKLGSAKDLGVTPRSVLLGLFFTACTDLWIHWAELIMSGGRGHSAVAATSTPVGGFCVLFFTASVNLLLRMLLPALALSGAELLCVYAMVTTACVLSSSGQLHFLVPTVVAAFHYANASNDWVGTFQRFIPDWMAQKDPTVLKGFYEGKTTPPWELWAKPMGAWIGFTLAVTFASLCLVSLLRRQWVDRERLAFPTVALPLEMMEPGVPIFRKPLFWAGLLLPFTLDWTNTLATNAPDFPKLNLRSDIFDIGAQFTSSPMNAMGNTPVSFYPFVIGLAYFIPVEVTFSSWFFFLLTRVERVIGAALNIDAGITGSGKAAFPFLGEQGAGAFLGLAIVSLWLSRSYVKEVFQKVFGEVKDDADADEPLSYRAAMIGLVCAIVFMVGFCIAGGMQPILAIVLILLALCYMVAATRIRAETGNAWLFGPEVDVNHLMTKTFGTSLMTPADLTILAYMRPAIANFDMRCLPMPHHFEAMKMADSVGGSRRRLFGALCIGSALGLVFTWVIALILWHKFGAEAGTDAWRTSMGRQPFDTLNSLLRNPTQADPRGIGAIGFGFIFTAALMLLRGRFTWWPLHPVGYAMANTNTMTATWVPFLIAWLVKILLLRYGGAGLYRKGIPFFLGLVAGDLLGGGTTTLFGAFFDFNVYPINW